MIAIEVRTNLTALFSLCSLLSALGFPPATHTGEKNLGNPAGLAAQSALTVAFNEAAGKAADTVLSNQDLGGMTLLPGVYKFAGAASLNGILTLDAQDANSAWTFQIGKEMLFSADSAVIFDGLGYANAVTWQVGTSATLQKNAAVIGNVLADQSISVAAKATVNGRLLARIAAVTLVVNTVTVPV
jgi:hypothetical protein